MIRKLKNTLIYFFARISTFAVGSIPRNRVAVFGRMLGTAAAIVARRERRIAEHQLTQAFRLLGKSGRLRVLVRGVFRELGTSAVEICRLLSNREKNPNVHLTDTSKCALNGALAENRGVIFVTGHIGNWELMALTLSKLGYPVSTVARESYDPRFTHFVEKFRKSVGVQSIYRGQVGASAKMLRALRQNRLLGLLIDQDTTVPSAFVTFFGKPASTPVGAAVLANRTGAPVVVGTIQRVPRGCHVIQIERVRLPKDTVGATALLTRRLENRIRNHPAQWVWFHKRWKTQPEIEGPP